jgi:hypothetical protein
MIGFIAIESLQAMRQIGEKPQASHIQDILAFTAILNLLLRIALCTKIGPIKSFCTIDQLRRIHFNPLKFWF